MISKLLALTGDIVSAHVASNTVSANDVPAMITAVYAAFERLGAPVETVEEPAVPAVSIRSSVKPDSIACLECGKRFKTLKRHVGMHQLSETEYRAKWKLPADYPMVSADYSAFRADMAKKIGLGGKPKAAPPEPSPAQKTRKKLGVSVA